MKVETRFNNGDKIYVGFVEGGRSGSYISRIHGPLTIIRTSIETVWEGEKQTLNKIVYTTKEIDSGYYESACYASGQEALTACEAKLEEKRKEQEAELEAKRKAL